MPIRDSVLFSGTNYINVASITGSSTVQGFPLENCKKETLSDFVRLSGTSGFVQMAIAPKSLQIFSVLKHSFGINATWRIRLASSAATIISSPSYDSGIIPIANSFGGFGDLPWGEFDLGNLAVEDYEGFQNFHAYHLLENPVQASVVRIDFSDFEGVQQFARLWLGPIYQPSLNALYGSSIKPIDTTKEKVHESGRVTFGTRRQKKAFLLNFELPEKELFFSIYGPLFSLRGKRGEVLCILQPLNEETWTFEAIYGNLADVSDITKSFWKYGTTQITINEKI